MDIAYVLDVAAVIGKSKFYGYSRIVSSGIETRLFDFSSGNCFSGTNTFTFDYSSVITSMFDVY